MKLTNTDTGQQEAAGFQPQCRRWWLVSDSGGTCPWPMAKSHGGRDQRTVTLAWGRLVLGSGYASTMKSSHTTLHSTNKARCWLPSLKKREATVAAT